MTDSETQNTTNEQAAAPPVEFTERAAAQEMVRRMEAEPSTTTQSTEETPAIPRKSDDAHSQESDEADTTTTADDSTESDEQEPRFTVTIDGEVHRVTLEELQKGYSRQRDYTSKTQQVADERRKLDADRQQVEQHKQTYLQAAQQAVQLAQAGQDPVISNWVKLGDDGRTKLAQDDPATFTAKQAEFQSRYAKLQQMDADLKSQREQSLREITARESDLLLKAIPEWKNKDVGAKESQAVLNFLVKHGISQETVNGINDHRTIAIARKAMLYDQLQEAKATLKDKKVPNQPTKSLRPGNGDANRADTSKSQMMAKARKSGNISEMTKALVASLNT